MVGLECPLACYLGTLLLGRYPCDAFADSQLINRCREATVFDKVVEGQVADAEIRHPKLA